MLVKDLIKRLNQIVEANPNNAYLEIKWYDNFDGNLCKCCDGSPVRLFQNIYTGFKYCILNATRNPPAYGLEAISDKGQNINEIKKVPN